MATQNDNERVEKLEAWKQSAFFFPTLFQTSNIPIPVPHFSNYSVFKKTEVRNSVVSLPTRDKAPIPDECEVLD